MFAWQIKLNVFSSVSIATILKAQYTFFNNLKKKKKQILIT